MKDANEPAFPEIAVAQANPEEQTLLRRLLELCQHNYSEFNILRKYRCRGVGQLVAQQVFARFPRHVAIAGGGR